VPPDLYQTLHDLVLRTLQEDAAKAGRREQEQLASRREFIEKLSSVNFDKAATFMSLVIGGGYAGLFAIWGWVSNYLYRWETLTIAMLLAISITAFVAWQVFGMVSIARQQMRFARAIVVKDVDFDAEMGRANKQNLAAFAVIMKLWPYAIAVIATPAAIGALLLILACAEHLLTGAKNPELIQV
jgi:hypothetical protein